LRGKEFNLTLHSHVMPKTGKMLADKLVTPLCHVNIFYVSLAFSITDIIGSLKELESGKMDYCLG
jgi:kynureninase